MIFKYVIPVSEPDYDVLLVMLGLLSNIILFDKAKFNTNLHLLKIQSTTVMHENSDGGPAVFRLVLSL